MGKQENAFIGETQGCEGGAPKLRGGDGKVLTERTVPNSNSLKSTRPSLQFLDLVSTEQGLM